MNTNLSSHPWTVHINFSQPSLDSEYKFIQPSLDSASKFFQLSWTVHVHFSQLSCPEIQICPAFLDSAYTLFPATVSWSAQKIVRCPGLKTQICSCYTGKCNYSSHPGQPKQIFSIFLARALFYASSQNEGSERIIIIDCLQT